ncbi:MAG: tetraacyldisaccharide 4'-kinase [Aquidulcibacter sp.]|uniref:tetraacyldisaccharide 4'-kinase n=1 Tax=Aquidulcibacter sp. TaxID=2052990 RepID=UPI0022C47D34|nr:tetraacyldisaccharide 4'-kinase [Aquidulcibacter sp.]MCZ8209253.1 tetraacyldisaccharide 4'-kinase [Aquidulcibacter sp.]
MRAPSFWTIRYGRDSAPILRLLLSPLGALYGASVARRIAKASPLSLSIPVISIGNLTAGGTGKTPFSETLRTLLAELLGGQIGIVSRGYGGSLEGPVAVDPAVHGADAVGDEPLMLAQGGPVFVGRDRAAAGKLAAQNGMKALILDDGHQNPALAKIISLVVVDGQTGFGNGHLIPAGPLREKPAIGLARADAIIVMGAVSDDALEDIDGFKGPVFKASLNAKPVAIGGPVLGFCGIGRPEKFDATLRSLGLNVVDLYPFADHHRYRPDELVRLEADARAAGATLVTTEKDYVRLPPDFAAKVQVVAIEAILEDEAAFLAFLRAKLDSHLGQD